MSVSNSIGIERPWRIRRTTVRSGELEIDHAAEPGKRPEVNRDYTSLGHCHLVADPGYGRTSASENSPNGVGHTSLAMEKYCYS